MCALNVSAQHFEAKGIAYDIIDSGQVEVSASNQEQPYEEFVITPATVSNDNTVYSDRSHDVPISLLEKGSLTSMTTNAFFVKKDSPVSIMFPLPIGAGPLAFKVDGTSTDDTSSNAILGTTICYDFKALEGTPFDIFTGSVVLEFKSVDNDHNIVVTRLSSVDVINNDEVKDNMSHIYGMDGISMSSRFSQGIYIMTDGKNAVKRLMP